MKILWFTWKDLKHPKAGGAEVVNEELAKRLVAEGHEVTFIVANFKGKVQDSVDRSKMEGLDRITLAPSSELQTSKGKPKERIYVNDVKKTIHPEEFSTGRGSSLSTNNFYTVIRVGNRWSVYFRAMQYYKRHLSGWADLVIDEVNTMPFFAGLYAKEPVVMFYHMLCRKIWFYQLPKLIGWGGYVLEPLYLRLLKNHTAITVSESTKQDLIRHGYTAENIHIISEGIDLTPIDWSQVKGERQKVKGTEPILLSFGAIRAMKRTLDQVKAFEIAKQKIPNLRLIIAGDTEGGYAKKVLRYISRSRYRDDIEVRGRVSRKEKATLLQKAHLTLSTSVKEGWGLTITEANSQGTPAVVYDVDGLRDAVQHNQTGLVSEETPESMAKHIVSLLKDSKRYNKLRSAAHDLSHTINFDRSHQDFKEILEI